MSCRNARAGLRPMILSGLANVQIERHLDHCANCAAEYALLKLEKIVLDASSAVVPIEPGPEFFAAVRARIYREAEGGAVSYSAEDGLANVLWLTARQLVPALTLLLAVIIGATLIWGAGVPKADLARQEASAMLRPTERVLFHDLYDTPQPTTDDVLESLVAVDEKDNGK